MNCIKPSGPYIAILLLVLVASFAQLPKSNKEVNHGITNQLLTDKEEEGKLKQIENISMLNMPENE
ncbi:MAG: hypothetical protein MI810_03485 [Flavobacteriales bacterium]|nr:hypothetical protein [Flavobacteriales bacterium]